MYHYATVHPARVNPELVEAVEKTTEICCKDLDLDRTKIVMHFIRPVSDPDAARVKSEQEIAGLMYWHRQNEFFIRWNLSPDEARLTAAHELKHIADSAIFSAAEMLANDRSIEARADRYAMEFKGRNISLFENPQIAFAKTQASFEASEQPVLEPRANELKNSLVAFVRAGGDYFYPGEIRVEDRPEDWLVFLK